MNTDHINILLDLRENISKDIQAMQTLLKENFPKEYYDAYQHWIPQILTALYNDTKWLPRGQLTVQNTIDRIRDKDHSGGGVSKFIQ